MKVYWATYNCGDGPATAHFFRNKPDLDALIEEDEDYMICEEIGEFEIPDGPNTIQFED